MSALMASAGISSDPAAFTLFRVMMAFLISVSEGLSQLMGISVSAGGMSGGESGVGLSLLVWLGHLCNPSYPS